jgi:hypothetical protein
MYSQKDTVLELRSQEAFTKLVTTLDSIATATFPSSPASRTMNVTKPDEVSSVSTLVREDFRRKPTLQRAVDYLNRILMM